MKRYDSYKDSGVEWIGDIPGHWKSTKVKFEIQSKGYKAGPFGSSLITSELLLNGNIKVFSPEHVAEKEILEEWYLPDERAEEMSQFIVGDKDVVLPIVGTLGLARVFHSNLDGIGIINQRLAKISCDTNRLVPEFFCLIMKEVSNYQEYFKLKARGSILSHLNKETIVSMPLALPDIEEQELITNYLDQKTTQIDDLIAKKERLIQLLEEERTAIINQAVTKGLDPTVPMKDSGIEWLGEIPAHWSYSSLKWFSKIYSGGTPSKDIEEYWIDGTIPWLNSGCVNQWDITEVSDYITEDAFNNSSAKWIPNQSLVIALAGQGKTKGMVAQVKFETTCNQSLGVIVPNEKINNRFLQYWLKNNYQNIRSLGGGDKRDGLNLVMIGGIPIPVLPLIEQEKIAKLLDSKNIELDTVKAKTQQEIELLKEYKTALISEVVTGKVDVRNEKLS